MIRLRSDAEYEERRRELMALEEIADACVGVIEKTRHHSQLRPELTIPLERFAETLTHSLDEHLDRPLTVRREATRLYEDLHASRRNHPSEAHTGDAGRPAPGELRLGRESALLSNRRGSRNY